MGLRQGDNEGVEGEDYRSWGYEEVFVFLPVARSSGYCKIESEAHCKASDLKKNHYLIINHVIRKILVVSICDQPKQITSTKEFKRLASERL